MNKRVSFVAFATVLICACLSSRPAHAVTVEISVTGTQQQISSTTLDLVAPDGVAAVMRKLPNRPATYRWDVSPADYTLRATGNGRSVDTPLTVPASGRIRGTYDVATNTYMPVTRGGGDNRRWSFNLGADALIPVQNQEFKVGGTSAGNLSFKNGDAVPMFGLNAGVAYRTGLGFSLGGGLMAGIAPSNDFVATGRSPGGFDVTVKSSISLPILAPYIDIGTRIPHAGNVFFQTGFWVEQDRVNVSLKQGTFSESFAQDQDVTRPFIGIGYRGPFDCGNLGLGNIANLGRMEVRLNAMYVFPGSKTLLPGGNNLSFATFEPRGNFAFSAGLSWGLGRF